MESAFSGNRLVVTQGDPEGIGPDLILRAQARALFGPGDEIVACPTLLEERANRIAAPWAREAAQTLRPFLRPEGLRGRSQFSSLELAVTRVLEAKDGAALVTAPIDKKVAAGEGLTTPGHTEYLAMRAGAPEVAMLMAGPRLRVTLATVHIPLDAVSAALDATRIEARSALLIAALRDLYKIHTPRIALLGVNPHAGEQGRFGTEEQDLLEGCVARLAQRYAGQAQILGPLPADTAFYQHAQGHYDGLVAMYHDQGLAPFKLMHFYDGVNVTLGLPFVRCSPDHGTAKDRAGQDDVDPRSFFSAITLARGKSEDIDAWIKQGQS